MVQFGTGGWRAIIGDGFTRANIRRISAALARQMKLEGQAETGICVGYDRRFLSREAAIWFSEVAAGEGIFVRFVNLSCPTPLVMFTVRNLALPYGAMITASHNPYYDNGIKFFSAEGTKLPDEVEMAIEQALDGELNAVTAADFGRAFRQDDAPGRYVEFCKGHFDHHMTLEGLTLVLDCANGATYHVAPLVFRELGARVITIGTQPDGININDECGSTHPKALQDKVLVSGADLGIAFDGDGDRVLMVDRHGTLRDGDCLLYVIACDRASQGKLHGGVVGTLMSNLGLEQALAQEQIPFERAAVGDRYVMERLQARNWHLGGENSGHIICLDYVTTGDGIVSALQVLKACLRQGRSLAELCAPLRLYPQELVNVRTQAGFDALQDARVLQQVRTVEQELGQSGRVLLRNSGTEPVVRVMVEGAERERVRQMARSIADVIVDQSGEA